MMKLKKIFGFPTLMFIFIWGLLFLAGQSKLFRDPGSFSHTAIGAYILDTSQLIYKDVFSFTRFGQPWIAQQWLGECFMAVIQRLAGFDGLLVVTVSLIALLYSYLALRIERSGMNLALGTFILMFSLAASSHHLHVRPHIATMIFMVIIYALLCDVETGRKKIKSLLWLIPVFILWSNIHGGALGGLFTLFLTVAAWTLAGLLGRKQFLTEKKDVALLWFVTLLCFLTPLVNPYGIKLPLTWIKIMGSSAIGRLIIEHASVYSLLRHGDAAAYVTAAVLICLSIFYFSLLTGIEIFTWSSNIAAIKRVGEEMRLSNKAISEEFRILNLEMRAGKERKEAMRSMADRIDLEDVSSWVTLLIQTDKLGTSIAQALRIQSDSLRTKRSQRLEELAAKIPVKLLFPTILFIFPSLFVAILGPAVIRILKVMSQH